MDEANKISLVIYSPESKIRHPLLLWRSLWQDIRASRELAWRLFVRDTAAQYRQSLLGVLWAFVPPIVTSLIFIFLQARNVVDFGTTDIPYPVYVLVGMFLWQIFSDSVNAPLKSVTASKSLLVKISFPREALILSSFYSVLLNAAIKMVVIVIAFVLFRLTFTWGILLAILPILGLVLLGLCIGLLLTPFGMLYTDITTSLPIVIQLLFFITPVVYPPITTYPLSILVSLNPVTPLLIMARDLITKGTVSNLVPCLVVSGFVLVFLVIGLIIYRLALPILIERMSA